MNEELQETESAASAVNPASLSTHVGEMLWPEVLKVEADTLSNEYGRFAVEALEQGFGLTIGHMLRRTLLSSIRGSAVFAVQIEGVAHEFTQLPGILEDVVQIILNFKNLDRSFIGARNFETICYNFTTFSNTIRNFSF